MVYEHFTRANQLVDVEQGYFGLFKLSVISQYATTVFVVPRSIPTRKRGDAIQTFVYLKTAPDWMPFDFYLFFFV